MPICACCLACCLIFKPGRSTAGQPKRSRLNLGKLHCGLLAKVGMAPLLPLLLGKEARTHSSSSLPETHLRLVPETLPR